MHDQIDISNIGIEEGIGGVLAFLAKQKEAGFPIFHWRRLSTAPRKRKQPAQKETVG